jgi:hypothetical protein
VGINGHAADAADRRAGTKRGLGVRGVAAGTRDRPQQSGGWIGEALRGAHGSRLPFPARMKRAIEGMDGSTWDTFATKTVVDSARPSASTVISGARSDIGPEMVRISFLSLLRVAVTGPQPSGPTGRARTVTVGGVCGRP